MKRLSFLIVLFSLVMAWQPAEAKNYIYRQGNNAANYIKLVNIKGSKAEALALNQPYTFTEDKMADILRSLRYSRRALFSDKIKTRRVFEEEYIEKYTPYLVKAFSEAKASQKVYFSIAQQRPYFILRNDRLSQVLMWVSGQELHIRFDKTDAKVLGDYKARTPEGRRMRQQAKGLRISLEPQEGQKFAFDSSREIIVDINANWETIVPKIEAEEERIRKEQELKKARGSKRKKLEEKYRQETTTTTYPSAATLSVKEQQGAEQRLSELKRLKDKGLINSKDYERKKQEILEGL